MKRREHQKNFIIYLFLVVLLITGAGYGLDEEGQVFSSLCEKQESSIFAPTIFANDNIHTFEVRESSSVALRYIGSRNNRATANLRGDLAFLCVLAILLVFFRLIHEVFTYFARLYVREWFSIITFMQNADGRKRIS